MLAVTVIVNPGGGSSNVGVDLFSLINTAVSGLVGESSVRVAEIYLCIKTGGIIRISHKPGALNIAIDVGYELQQAAIREVHLGPYIQNVLSLKDIFVSAADEQSLFVLANIV